LQTFVPAQVKSRVLICQDVDEEEDRHRRGGEGKKKMKKAPVGPRWNSSAPCCISTINRMLRLDHQDGLSGDRS
jgi:hypothetical protein